MIDSNTFKHQRIFYFPDYLTTEKTCIDKNKVIELKNKYRIDIKEVQNREIHIDSLNGSYYFIQYSWLKECKDCGLYYCPSLG